MGISKIELWRSKDVSLGNMHVAPDAGGSLEADVNPLSMSLFIQICCGAFQASDAVLDPNAIVYRSTALFNTTFLHHISIRNSQKLPEVVATPECDNMISA